jgi:hypothetical protein
VITIIDNDTNSSVAVRKLPGFYSAGTPFTVRIQTTPNRSTTAYAVEDVPPAGWVAANVSQQGVFDLTTGKVKFGPFFDNVARELTYELTPPSDASGLRTFVGSISVDGVSQAIAGDQNINSVSPYHPADRNPANYTISIDELTAYCSAWKHGDTWPTDPNPIPINYVTRAGALWKGGEMYAFDPSLGDPPLCWVNVSMHIQLKSARLTSGTNAVPTSTNENVVARELAVKFVPGTHFTVTIVVTPATNTLVYAVEDQPPAGWSVSSINEEGVYDPVNQKVKWIFMDKSPRRLSYRVIPTGCAPGSKSAFKGSAVFDSMASEPEKNIAGLQELTYSLPDYSGTEPMIFNLVRPSDSVTLLTIHGIPGKTHVIQASSDMQNWTNIGEIIPTDAVFQVRNVHGASSNQFYRVKSLP